MYAVFDRIQETDIDDTKSLEGQKVSTLREVACEQDNRRSCERSQDPTIARGSHESAGRLLEIYPCVFKTGGVDH